MIGQGSAITVARHVFLTDEAIVFQAVKHVAALAAWCPAGVAVQTDIFFCTIHHGMADNIHLGEVDVNALDAECFGFHQGNAGMGPASGRAMLVANGRDWNFLDCSKLESFFFLFILCLDGHEAHHQG